MTATEYRRNWRRCTLPGWNADCIAHVERGKFLVRTFPRVIAETVGAINRRKEQEWADQQLRSHRRERAENLIG